MVIREGVRKNSHFPQVMEYDNNPVLYQQTCTAIIIKLIICLQWGCHLPNHAVITPTHKPTLPSARCEFMQLPVDEASSRTSLLLALEKGRA